MKTFQSYEDEMLDRASMVWLLRKLGRKHLYAYAKSHGIKRSGTKRQLAINIFEARTCLSFRLVAPPGGVLSIGIALEHDVVEGPNTGEEL